MAHLLVALTLFFASVLQGAVGFAFNLLAIPLLAAAGVPLSAAVALTLVPGTVQLVLSVLTLRRDVPWRAVFQATGIRLVSLPVGILLLVKIDALPQTQVQQILGGVVLVALALQSVSHRQTETPPNTFWSVVAFAASGVMQGVSSMGGPPAVLWVMAQRWETRRSRAFLQSLFLLALPVQVALLFLAKGQSLVQPMVTGALYLPLVFLGTFLGVWLGDKLSRDGLRRVAFGILGLTAFSSFLRPLL